MNDYLVVSILIAHIFGGSERSAVASAAAQLTHFPFNAGGSATFKPFAAFGNYAQPAYPAQFSANFQPGFQNFDVNGFPPNHAAQQQPQNHQQTNRNSRISQALHQDIYQQQPELHHQQQQFQPHNFQYQPNRFQQTHEALVQSPSQQVHQEIGPINNAHNHNNYASNGNRPPNARNQGHHNGNINGRRNNNKHNQRNNGNANYQQIQQPMEGTPQSQPQSTVLPIVNTPESALRFVRGPATNLAPNSGLVVSTVANPLAPIYQESARGMGTHLSNSSTYNPNKENPFLQNVHASQNNPFLPNPKNPFLPATMAPNQAVQTSTSLPQNPFLPKFPPAQEPTSLNPTLSASTDNHSVQHQAAVPTIPPVQNSPSPSHITNPTIIPTIRPLTIQPPSQNTLSSNTPSSPKPPTNLPPQQDSAKPNKNVTSHDPSDIPNSPKLPTNLPLQNPPSNDIFPANSPTSSTQNPSGNIALQTSTPKPENRLPSLSLSEIIKMGAIIFPHSAHYVPIITTTDPSTIVDIRR